jgi:hypothetical protein
VKRVKGLHSPADFVQIDVQLDFGKKEIHLWLLVYNPGVLSGALLFLINLLIKKKGKKEIHEFIEVVKKLWLSIL